MNELGSKTVASCCGHGIYKPTIFVEEMGWDYEQSPQKKFLRYREHYSGLLVVPDKRKQLNFYIKDKKGYYFNIVLESLKQNSIPTILEYFCPARAAERKGSCSHSHSVCWDCGANIFKSKATVEISRHALFWAWVDELRQLNQHIAEIIQIFPDEKYTINELRDYRLKRRKYYERLLRRREGGK
jgi:hypothetical protein